MTTRSGTHIETLADDTPKSRRRVRHLMHLTPFDRVNSLHVMMAQERAVHREGAGARADALARKQAMADGKSPSMRKGGAS